MGKHKKVFKEAVSEMKHFLMGAALVMTLVAVMPVLAQEVRSGDRPSLPSAGGDAGLRSADDNRGQAGADIRQGQQGTDMRQGQQGTDMRQGQRGTDMRQGQQGTDMRQGQRGTDMRQGQRGTDARQGQVDQTGARQSVEPQVEKRQAEIKIQLIDFDDLEEDYTFSVAVSAVAESIVDPALVAIESDSISKKKIRSFVNKVSKALRASEKQVCATFEVDDRKACADIYKSFKNNSRNIKTTEALAEALQVFMDDLNTLAGISVDAEDDLLEEEEEVAE